jgi:hypothetical protein
MRRIKIFGILAGIVFCLLLVALSFGHTEKKPELAIDLESRADSVQRGATLLRLSNVGSVPIRLTPFCTLYWTNLAGVSTYCFYEHTIGHSILPPGMHKLVAITPPPEVNVWYSSFTYEVNPNTITRAVNHIESLFPWGSVPRQPFTVRLGPLITNLTHSNRDQGIKN